MMSTLSDVFMSIYACFIVKYQLGGYFMLILNVEKLLKDRKMSKEKLCNLMGISRTNLNHAIRNHNSISYKYLEGFCKYLNCTIDELLIFIDNDKG